MVGLRRDQYENSGRKVTRQSALKIDARQAGYTMKLAVELPDELYHRVEAQADREGVPLSELIVRSLGLVLPEPQQRLSCHMNFLAIRARPGSRPITFEQVKAALQAMDEKEDRRTWDGQG